MFSSLLALSMVLTFEHAPVTGTLLLSDVTISLDDDLRCLAISPADHNCPNPYCVSKARSP